MITEVKGYTNVWRTLFTTFDLKTGCFTSFYVLSTPMFLVNVSCLEKTWENVKTVSLQFNLHLVIKYLKSSQLVVAKRTVLHHSCISTCFKREKNIYLYSSIKLKSHWNNFEYSYLEHAIRFLSIILTLQDICFH